MIIKQDSINKLATKILTDYISKGYILSSTMSGHQGEIYKIDLYKDNEVIRIRVDRGRSKNENKNHNFFGRIDVVYIIVERFHELKGTLWNGEGEELEYIEFYEVDRHKGVYCDNYAEYLGIKEKQDIRLSNSNKYSNTKTILRINKYSDKLLKMVQNVKGYKSIRKNQIKGVESFTNIYSKKKYYRVAIDGKTDLIFNL